MVDFDALAVGPAMKALGRDKAWADEWSNRIEALWRTWAEGTDCDVGRTLDFAGLTQLALRSGLLDSEAPAPPLWQPGDGPYRANASFCATVL